MKTYANARELAHCFVLKCKNIEKSEIVNLVRGRGLLNAIVINDTEDSKTAWNICKIA